MGSRMRPKLAKLCPKLFRLNFALNFAKLVSVTYCLLWVILVYPPLNFRFSLDYPPLRGVN